MNQAALFDESGRVLRDHGMALATDKADRHEPAWSDRAEAKLIEFLDVWTGDFTGEGAQAWMLLNGLSNPASANAWGSTFNRAARNGLIVKTGQYRESKKPNARARAVPVWRKA